MDSSQPTAATAPSPPSPPPNADLSASTNTILPTAEDIVPVPAPASAEPGSHAAAPAPLQTLDQELASVMAGFGSFWGKVRKQSVTAYQTAEKQFETARKDLSPLVTKARANLDSLAETTKAELHRLSEITVEQQTNVVVGADGMPMIIDTTPPPPPPVSVGRVDKGKGVDRTETGAAGEGSEDATATATATPAAIAAASATAFFTRVQSQLASNPNLQELSKNLSTLQTSVQTNLSHLPSSMQTNLTQLQSQFSHLSHDIHLADSQKLAEGYLHKGEHWLAEFSGEVARLAKDVVTVVPPSGPGARGAQREERMRKAEQVAVGRRDTLLLRLRKDSEGLLVDPSKPPVPLFASGAAGDTTSTTTVAEGASTASLDTREAFAKFLQAIEDRGGFEGEAWTKEVANELEEAGEALGELVAKLVPDKMDRETFWSRYFFKREGIEVDEKRRREILEVAVGESEDFSWDMEEEEQEAATLAAATGAPPAPVDASSSLPSQPASTPSHVASPRVPEALIAPQSESGSAAKSPSVSRSGSGSAGAGVETSPRASSDGTSSYDVVGAASGNQSATEERDTGADGGRLAEKKAKESDGEDSDWE